MFCKEYFRKIFYDKKNFYAKNSYKKLKKEK